MRDYPSIDHLAGICEYFAKCFSILVVILLGIQLPGELCAEEQRVLSGAREKALRKTVDAFWGAWQRRDYAKAAQFVLPEQQTRFLRLRKFPVRGWQIESIKSGKTKSEVIVTTVVDRLEAMMTDYFKWRHIATWVEKNKKWYLLLRESM